MLLNFKTHDFVPSLDPEEMKKLALKNAETAYKTHQAKVRLYC